MATEHAISRIVERFCRNRPDVDGDRAERLVREVFAAAEGEYVLSTIYRAAVEELEAHRDGTIDELRARRGMS